MRGEGGDERRGEEGGRRGDKEGGEEKGGREGERKGGEWEEENGYEMMTLCELSSHLSVIATHIFSLVRSKAPDTTLLPALAYHVSNRTPTPLDSDLSKTILFVFIYVDTTGALIFCRTPISRFSIFWTGSGLQSHDSHVTSCDRMHVLTS